MTFGRQNFRFAFSNRRGPLLRPWGTAASRPFANAELDAKTWEKLPRVFRSLVKVCSANNQGE